MLKIELWTENRQIQKSIHFRGKQRMNKVAIPLRMEGENKEHSTFLSTKEKVPSQAENPSVHHYYIFTNLV